MRILLLCHAFNCLAQRLWVELAADGHDVSLELDVNDATTAQAAALWRPDVVIAPFLKRAIPETLWRAVRCLVVHPGIPGDRGPAALDWAILRGERDWGVTVLQGNAVMDAGDIWASAAFPMRAATKSSLYRNEVTEAAVGAVRLALERMAGGTFRPRPLDYADPEVLGRPQPPVRHVDRAIEWARDDTETILRKILSADSQPGVLDEVLGVRFHLFDAHREPGWRAHRAAPPGTVVGHCDGAILRATTDGAVWIGHLRRVPADREPALKLPAAQALGDALAGVPRVGADPVDPAGASSWPAIRYEERGAVGVLRFAFYNGAMGTAQCEALRAAVAAARMRPTRVLLLAGGPDFWSNGIHLNLIEAEADPAEASWRNINAMDDLVREIVTAERQLTMAALQGNAGAGGAFLALAADCVHARRGIVLNPHYKSMGNLYGSEYWTYLLPRRVGPARAREIAAARLPMGTAEAAAIGLVDEAYGRTPDAFLAEALLRAQALAAAPDWAARLEAKVRRRREDEAAKPLDAYRAEELERMKLNFFGFDPSYHVARYHFVHKLPKARTPSHLSRHRTVPGRHATPATA